MASTKYHEAELYVDVADRNLLKPILASYWGVDPVHSFFRLPGFTVSIGKHKAYVRDAAPGYFLGWQTLIDVNTEGDTTDREMVEFMGNLVAVLNSAGYRSEPVCAFSAEIERPEGSHDS